MKTATFDNLPPGSEIRGTLYLDPKAEYALGDVLEVELPTGVMIDVGWDEDLPREPFRIVVYRESFSDRFVDFHVTDAASVVSEVQRLAREYAKAAVLNSSTKAGNPGKAGRQRGARALDDDVRVVYEFLTTRILANGERPTVTYGRIVKATGVPMGVLGGYIGRVLGEISRRCAEHGLPPLTSIVVGSAARTPGPGYFIELAQMLQRGNPAGWRIDPGIERWAQRPAPRGFNKDTERLKYREMIDEHQQSVWKQKHWPRAL